MCTLLLPPGVNPIAVDKYIISYISEPAFDYIQILLYHTLFYLFLDGRFNGALQPPILHSFKFLLPTLSRIYADRITSIQHTTHI